MWFVAFDRAWPSPSLTQPDPNNPTPTHSTDYVHRGLELAREALHRLFKGALAAGVVDEIPSSRCIYRPQPDAFKLIEVALSEKNEGPLEAFLAEAGGENKDGSLRERLEGILASAAAAVSFHGSVTREEVGLAPRRLPLFSCARTHTDTPHKPTHPHTPHTTTRTPHRLITCLWRSRRWRRRCPTTGHGMSLTTRRSWSSSSTPMRTPKAWWVVL